MKQKLQNGLLAAVLLLFGSQLAAVADTVFFRDTFTNGSTINSNSPASPTTISAAYQLISSKSWSPSPTLAAGDLKVGIGSSTAGEFQLQALFATNPVALSQPGDYIQMTIVFTNTSGLLTEAGQLGFGLYSSGQVKPVPGGLNGTATTSSSSAATGYAQNWVGYVGQVNYSGAASRIMTRPAQTGTFNNNQDLITSGSSSTSYANASTVGATVTSAVTLTPGAAYTEVLVLTLNAANSLLISNSIYSGPTTNGTLLGQFGGVATNTTFLTGAFDAFAIGYFARASASSNTLDISSIQISGAVTVISGPPTITSEPVSVSVATNGACPFSVSAVGFGVSYQWHRNGTNLINGGNISGATSSTLVISPAGPADAVSGANGYYVTVTGTGPFSTNSVTNSLSLVPPATLTFTATGGATWDLNNTVSWQDSNSNPQPFNYGDSVVFDDTASLTYVTLTGSYLSPASIKVNSQNGATYTFTGTGNITGPGNLLFTGTGQLTLNTANSFSGGTLVSNTVTPASQYILLENYNGLGTGPVTLDSAGSTLETTVTGGSATGINGTINLLDDFTILVDGTGTFATVFLGDLSGTSGKTLTINPKTGSSVSRYRAYGTNTSFNANLVLDNVNSGVTESLYGGSSLAPYNASGSQSYNGVISGAGGIVQRGTGTTYLNNPNNTYSGGTFPTAGSIGLGADSIPTTGTVTSGPLGTGSLFLAPENGGTTGSGTVFASGGARTIANPIQYPSGTNNLTLIIGGTNDLTFTSPLALNGIDGVTSNAYTARLFQIANTGATVFTGVISDSSSFYGLTKSGAGPLYLDAANTYSGVTTNSAGLLAGSGSVAGSVIVTTNATIGGGDKSAIGTFAIGGNLLLTNGGGFFRVNRAGLASDKVSVAGGATNFGTGTVTISNQGTTLQVGDVFTLFNKAVVGGATLSVVGGGVAWGDNLAVNGTVVVLSPPDVALQLTAPASVPLGALITNTIVLTNAGPGVALSLVITDALPANVKFVSATGGGSTNANVGQVVWSSFNLAANTSTNLTLVLNPTAGGKVVNSATVSGSITDPNPANNTGSALTAVTTTIIPGVSPRIGTFSLTGGNVVIGGTNGVNGGTYYLLASTNVAKPLAQWTTVATNIVATNGITGAFTFTGTNVVNPALGKQFFILSNTNY